MGILFYKRIFEHRKMPSCIFFTLKTHKFQPPFLYYFYKNKKYFFHILTKNYTKYIIRL